MLILPSGHEKRSAAEFFILRRSRFSCASGGCTELESKDSRFVAIFCVFSTVCYDHELKADELRTETMGGDVHMLGKFLYFSLSNILVEKEPLVKLKQFLGPLAIGHCIKYFVISAVSQ